MHVLNKVLLITLSCLRHRNSSVVALTWRQTRGGPHVCSVLSYKKNPLCFEWESTGYSHLTWSANHPHTCTYRPHPLFSNSPADKCRQTRLPTHTHTYTHSVVASPLYFWLVVQPEDEVGEQLEQVLPQQHGHVKVNVAYVRLAHVSGEAHVAHADELVDEVAAVASIQTGVGLALVHLLLTPADTRSHICQRPFSQGGDHL